MAISINLKLIKTIRYLDTNVPFHTTYSYVIKITFYKILNVLNTRENREVYHKIIYMKFSDNVLNSVTNIIL